MKLQYTSILVYYQQIYLPLHGQLPTAGCVITDSVPSDDVTLQYPIRMLDFN
jgi:hypothetical protein